MSIHVSINHRTHYRFAEPVGLSPHVVRLRPAPHCRTPISAYTLKVEPAKHFINWQQDPFGNYLARLVFPEKTTELSFEIDLVADMTVINPFDFFLEPSAEECPFQYDEQLASELAPYFEISERGPLLMQWVDKVDRSPLRTVDFLVALNRRLQQDIGYIIRFEPGVQTCEETLSSARGSCRDTGWLLVQILRHLGMAARFVSGYLVQLTTDIPALDGAAGPTKDFTDLHAWAEVYVPGAGWIGLDPTSGLFAGEGHIPLACAPNPPSAAPVVGFADPCETEFTYHNEVRRLHEDPRVTKPYTEAQWQTIDALGQRVDADLAAYDVRLTMGGEPTFVSIDDMEGAEWNTDATGPTKRIVSGDLLRALAARFASQGVLHFGQGKWYPGEQLPRWALSYLWRTDGHPLWSNPALLADEQRAYGFGLDHAARFTEALAAELGIAPDFVVAGYEDAFYYMWKEGTLPINVDPLHSNLDDPEERKRLAGLLRRGLGTVTGFALPLRWEWPDRTQHEGQWFSAHWEFRRARMYLLPGSSAMGYRLPLESLRWLPAHLRDPEYDRCQFAPRIPLPDASTTQHEARLQNRQHPAAVQNGPDGSSARGSVPQTGAAPIGGTRSVVSGSPDAGASRTSAEGVDVRSAVCVEPRDGRLYVFLPPVTHLEHYVDLLARIERTAAAVSMPILLEGYEPPRDPRLMRLSVTPDPGVIEVNVHPTQTWSELCGVTETVYEEARLCRLGTEKFMLDGRHTGTGGGNHITVGGPTPGDSPILRRPDVLQSFVTFWQHHPSLSYLFSGSFVGPTSQAPRVDEARNDSLYELEVAFQQVPSGQTPAPWLVDRVFRHLLIDSTGNTHRAEFCVDKLYSPDGPAGRLGLLEIRAFEMPPHARMSLLQGLLVRSLLATMWKEPYLRPLTRWNTGLHDRFMLPHFLWEDLREVLCHLDRAGYAFALEWFAPFLEFRFPRFGTVDIGHVSLELRMAVEPWHVLGEEVSSQGTARYVDSSVERLQVMARGLTPGRYVVACNGRRVPLRSTGRREEHVAGVRYRAWQPPSCLHPTIGVHAPLVFDVVDTWNGHSVGGCTYHVTHPGGRSYDTFPVNGNEAEARRVSRFWPYGHTPGPMLAPPEEVSKDFPHTLDLRRADAC